MMDNHTYDRKAFIASRKLCEIVHLPGIGRFCKNGCGRRIEAVEVTRNTFGKKVTFYRLPKNKLFCNRYCNDKYHNRKGAHVSKTSLKCQISLTVQHDKKPYRILSLYLKKGSKLDFKITRDHVELWNALENICRYRYLKKTIPQINHDEKNKNLVVEVAR